MTNPIHIFLVDDHAIVRAGVRALLASKGQFRIVGEASSGEEAVAKAPTVDPQPDIVLLDLSMPGMNGIETARSLKKELDGTRFIALSMHEDPEYVQGFLEAGGSGYVPKSSLETQLVDAILSVSRGEYYAPAKLLADLAREMATVDPYQKVKLTPREHEVVKHIAYGSTYKEIAERLGISEKTVATYRERASEKLGIKTRAELVRWALENNLLE